VVLLASAWGAAAPGSAAALSVQEAILRAKPAVALVSAEVRAEVTMDCGRGPVTVSPSPFVETGTGWFVDGRGFLVTNAHVIDPAHRLPPWVIYELKKKAVEVGCVEQALRARGLVHGQRPDIEDQIRNAVSLAAAKLTPSPRVTVLLSNGTKLAAEVAKFSPPLLLDGSGQPLPDSGRDLALLRVKDGVYPALALTDRDPNLGDPVHILGFPGVVLSHELLGQSARIEASVTSGAVSGLKQDAIDQDVIQTDAPAAYGNSGGPAITNDGTVVGVMTFVSISPVGGAIVQGFNFLIPAKDVRAFLRGTRDVIDLPLGRRIDRRKRRGESVGASLDLSLEWLERAMEGLDVGEARFARTCQRLLHDLRERRIDARVARSQRRELYFRREAF
jgi:S1-C subfamily serine protease